jgi:hypothetical protein
MPDDRPQRSRGQSGPISDIERFLMEVERLRRRSAEEKRAAEASPPVDEVEVVRPAPRRQPATPTPPQPQRKVVRPRPRRAERAADDAVLEVVPVRPAAAPSTVDDSTTAGAAQQGPVAVTKFGPPPSRTMQQLTGMLRSRDQVRAAILISEVLGPPLSRRRGRRPR